MKNFISALIFLMFCITAVQGTSLTFQNYYDFAAQIQSTVGQPYVWVQNASGGNSYIGDAAFGNFMLSYPLSMKYAAITTPTAYADTGVSLYDDSLNLLHHFHFTTSDYQRVEIKMIGGAAYIFVNGVEQDHSGAIADPSYVLWAPRTGDDAIWGSSYPLSDSSPDKYIFGGPENGYFLLKDMLNPATSGFYRANLTDPLGAPTLISATGMTTTFGKGSGTAETLSLTDFGGAAYQSVSTGTAYAGNTTWDLTSFFAASPPYGLYAVSIPSGSYKFSERIPYISSGASIEFDALNYTTGDTATMDYEISDGYYDTGTYSYHVSIINSQGSEIYDQPATLTAVSPYTGSDSYVWADSDITGQHYGVIWAHRLSDGEEFAMNYDICNLTSTSNSTSTFTIHGYVKDAETTNIIDDANIVVTQGSTVDINMTDVTGYYSTISTLYSNATTTIYASSTGYDSYSHTFSPPDGITDIPLNITLLSSTPTYTGLALGGIVRKPPFNITVDDASVVIQNGSYGSYSVTTNSAGYYIKNTLPNNYLWDVWGNKSGYYNSSVYQILVVGT